MDPILEIFLKTEFRQVPKEFGKKLILYVAFVQCFCQKYQCTVGQSKDMEGLLPKLFQSVSGYTIKEAAVNFDVAMPWNLLRSEPSLMQALWRLNHQIAESGCATETWLRRQIESIFNYGNAVPTVTPHVIREIVSKIANERSYNVLVDVCCGTYSMGLQTWLEASNRSEVICVGEEIDSYLCAVARLFLFFNGVERYEIREVNAMTAQPIQRAHNDGAAVFLADLPLTGSETVANVESEFTTANGSLYADWYMIQKILGEMVSGDRAFFLVTKGALVRKNEESLRQELLEKEWLDAVIHIPSEVLQNRNTSVELLICEKGRSKERAGKVLFADIGQLPGVRQTELSGIFTQKSEAISDDVSQFASNSGATKIVSVNEIAERNFSLYPPIYFASQKIFDGNLRLGSVARVVRGLQKPKLSKTGKRYLLNVRNIQNGKFSYDDADMVEEIREEWEQKYRIREDDIILTCKGSMLKIAIVPPDPPPAYIGDNLMMIRVDTEKYSPYVLYEYLLSEQGQQVLWFSQTGSTMRVIRLINLEQLVLPEYPKEVFQGIGQELKSAAIGYEKSMAELHHAYREKRSSLLEQLSMQEGAVYE